MKGSAQPQGGHRVRRFPRPRVAALHSPRALVADRPDGGRVPSKLPERSGVSATLFDK
jgi:hypothetical protein